MSNEDSCAEPTTVAVTKQGKAGPKVLFVLCPETWGFVQQLDLRTQIVDPVAVPHYVRGPAAYSGIPFVGPHRHRGIHENDVVLPWVCGTFPQPKIPARGRNCLVSLSNEWAERSLVGGPDIEPRPEVPSQEGDFRAQDAGIQVPMGPGFSSKGFDRPTAGNPPESGVSLEKLNRVSRRSVPPTPVQADGFIVIKHAMSLRRARLRALVSQEVP
jgi:hypothetical protein